MIPTIDSLTARLSQYLSAEQITVVRRAYFYAEQAHDGQMRKSGEPYVTHPLAVADILASMKMGSHTLIAAMLHDVIEDTEIDYQGLEEQFSPTVAMIVDGVSKLTHLDYTNRAEAQAENFQKMILAMAHDLRVIIVKLADRLHNMRTLGAMPPQKQRRIARETLDLYAPVAARLGMRDVQLELEDLAFRAHYPLRCRMIEQAVAKDRSIPEKKQRIATVYQNITQQLLKDGIDAEVSGRQKNLYGIYKKMSTRKRDFRDIMDLYTYVIVTDNVSDCYRTLGSIHSLYKPIENAFKDYIAIPKSTGYQSLHTSLFGGENIDIDVQIRTKDMDAVARRGIIEHGVEDSNDDEDGTIGPRHRAKRWVKGLVQMHQSAGSSMEFLAGVKQDLFPDEVYVFTPKGRVIELPTGSTPVDFAYALDPEIGNHCFSCKVDRKLVPLSSKLVNGQMVEIVTRATSRPNAAWTYFVATGKAQMAISHFLKNDKRVGELELGLRLLETYLASYNTSIDKIPPERVEQLLKELNIETFDDILVEIALGHQRSYRVGRRLLSDIPSITKINEPEKPVSILELGGMAFQLAKCCHPIYGDSITGYMSSGRGLVVHRSSCNNISALQDEPDKAVLLNWGKKPIGFYSAKLSADVVSQRGIVALLSSSVNAAGADVVSVELNEHDANLVEVLLFVRVQHRAQLERLIKKLQALSCVSRIERS